MSDNPAGFIGPNHTQTPPNQVVSALRTIMLHWEQSNEGTPTMPKTRTHLLAATLIALHHPASQQDATAKPIHFETLKLQLIEQHIRCDTCHASRQDQTLSSYGTLIADEGAETPITRRVRTVEAELSSTASDATRKAEAPRIDLDGDTIPNWVEILAGTNPSQPNERTDTHEQILRVISCKLCHTSISKRSQPGKNRAPHNAFGALLEKAGNKERNGKGRKGKNRKGRSQAGRNRNTQDSDATIPIAPRLKKAHRRDTDRDKVKNWDEIITFHHPADQDDTPSEEEVKSAKEKQRTRRKEDEGFGKIHK